MPVITFRPLPMLLKRGFYNSKVFAFNCTDDFYHDTVLEIKNTKFSHNKKAMQERNDLEKCGCG